MNALVEVTADDFHSQALIIITHGELNLTEKLHQVENLFAAHLHLVPQVINFQV